MNEINKIPTNFENNESNIVLGEENTKIQTIKNILKEPNLYQVYPIIKNESKEKINNNIFIDNNRCLTDRKVNNYNNQLYNNELIKINNKKSLSSHRDEINKNNNNTPINKIHNKQNVINYNVPVYNLHYEINYANQISEQANNIDKNKINNYDNLNKYYDDNSRKKRKKCCKCFKCTNCDCCNCDSCNCDNFCFYCPIECCEGCFSLFLAGCLTACCNVC